MKVSFAIKVTDDEKSIHWYWSGDSWTPLIKRAKRFEVRGEAASLADEFKLKKKRPYGTTQPVEVIKVYHLQRVEVKEQA